MSITLWSEEFLNSASCTRADILIECALGDQNIIHFCITILKDALTKQFQSKSNPSPVFAEFETQFTLHFYKNVRSPKNAVIFIKYVSIVAHQIKTAVFGSGQMVAYFWSLRSIRTCKAINLNTMEQNPWGGNSGRLPDGPWWSVNPVKESSPTTKHWQVPIKLFNCGTLTMYGCFHKVIYTALSNPAAAFHSTAWYDLTLLCIFENSLSNLLE